MSWEVELKPNTAESQSMMHLVLHVSRVGSGAHENCKISETVQDRTKVTITDEQEVTYALSIGTDIG